MRKIVYSVAMSLDGYLAGPNGEADWIVMDPEIDFMGMMARFDTVLMGRRTFEAVQAQGGGRVDAVRRGDGSHRHADEVKEQRRCVMFDGVFDHNECRAPD